MKIIQVVTSLFYVILYAYYGGALVMFFTTKPKLPFKTIEDVLKSSEWKVLMLKGMESVIQEKAKEVCVQ